MSKFLTKLKCEINNTLRYDYDGDVIGSVDKPIKLIDSLGENARRLLEIGIVQDRLVELGFSRFGLCDYVLTDNKGAQIVGIDFVNLIISTSYFGGEQYCYSYTSPTWQEDLINRVKELINYE